MKNIQIPESLFYDLIAYFVQDDKSKQELITEQLYEKMKKMQARKFYTIAKTSETAENKEKAYKSYLDIKNK